ncbi:hypothetical protein V2J09_002091, partial [Rumex salicifolius]
KCPYKFSHLPFTLLLVSFCRFLSSIIFFFFYFFSVLKYKQSLIELMGSQEEWQRTTTGWAAKDPSGILSPYTFNLRKTGEEDVCLKVICCGICHTDLHQIKNDLGQSRYPMVPGHEVVGEVLEVGSGVSKFKVGDRVGVGAVVGCCRKCHPCTTDEEQYCNKKIWNYNDVYTDGQPTQGGFAGDMVIPEGMEAEQAAPLLCAGVTVYSPLKHFGLNKSGLSGGILGLGGVGHMGVKIAKAMGHHVVVISSSDKKKTEALDHLGADDYVVSSDADHMQMLTESLDYIIDTVPAVHPLEPRSITGTFIGSMKEMDEMLQFCKDKNVTSQIEVVKMDYINKAFERLEKNDVRYRFVVDVAGSQL